MLFSRVYELLDNLLGLEISGDFLTTFHLINRITLIYVLGIVFVRLQRQFMAIHTPFNYILNFILGSVLAAAIVGEVAYFPVLGMTLFIFALNFLIAVAVYYSKTFESIIKGNPELLVKDGKVIKSGMRRHLITKDDLMDAIRKHDQSEELAHVEKAFFESDGEITIIVKSKRS